MRVVRANWGDMAAIEAAFYANIAAPSPVGGSADLTDALAEYLRREMPAGTVIGDPDWWAARIVRAISSRPAALAAPKDEQQNGHMPPFAAPASLLNADELAALHRFNECALDGEGYDVPKEMMQRLAEVGVVRRKSGAFYEHTEYGLAVLDGSHHLNIKTLVNRFLGWPLPEGLRPEVARPIGTHLMNADEAKAMFTYCLAATPAPQQGERNE
jgi:hypothetical protein